MVPTIVLLLCIVLVASSAFATINKPRLMLSKTASLHTLKEKPKAYLVSEKLDGIRAYWTGSKLLSRAGKLIPAPAWFTDVLPAFPIEGELWLDRGKFEKLLSITSRHNPIDEEWRQVKFMLFDLPSSNKSFEQRIEQLNRFIKTIDVPFIKLIPYHSFDSISQIETYFRDTLSQGGEGIMLNLARAHYLPGRQQAVLKIKPYYDAEAVVIDQVAGTGKFKGMMGALLVKDKQGRVFKIGTGFSDKERRDPPRFGQLVTYKYYGYTAEGKPKFASFLRVRKEE